MTARQLTQSEAIERDREERNIIPVRLHHTPIWLSKRLRHRFGFRGKSISNSQIVFEAAAVAGPYWLDHWGTAIHNGIECFVSEPYFDESNLPAVIRFAEIGGFTLQNHGKARSWWYPDNTTRLVFRPLSEEDESWHDWKGTQ